MLSLTGLNQKSTYGLMVKRLRRCPLTAESAVRFRMGLPKKETTPLVVLFLFFSTPLSGNDAATCLPSFVNLRKQILAEELRFTKVKSFRKSMQTETATSAWGDTTSLRGNDAATCLPSFVFASANFAVGSHRPHLYFPVSYIWETATSAWGYVLLRCVKRRGNLFAVVRICVSKFCRSSPFYGSRENPKRHANGNGNFRMGRYFFVARKKIGNFIFI